MTNFYPYDIKNLEVQGLEEEIDAHISIGPKGYVFPAKFRELAAKVYNMEVRPNDVYVFSYPRSGTTWTQELVWLVANDLDYERALKIPLTERYPFLEFSMLFDDALQQKILENVKEDEAKLKMTKAVFKSGIELANEMASPRFIKTHLPLSLLPPNILETKMLYVARDPRDAVVSYYHLINSMNISNFVIDFKKFWHSFIHNYQTWSPYFEHVKEAWENRNHPNMLFIFYEDMRKDLSSSVRRVCDFFGKKYSDEQIAGLCDHLKIDNFKNNPSVNYDLMKELGFMKPNEEFIRKGKSGGWRDYFDEEMITATDKWMEENLRGTDLRFPSMQ